MTEEIYLDTIPQNEIYLDQISTPNEPDEVYLDDLDKQEHPSFFTNLGKSIMGGFTRIAQSWLNFGRRLPQTKLGYAVSEKVRPFIEEKTGWDLMSIEESIAKEQEFFKGIKEYWKPTGEGKEVWVASVLGQAIPQVLTGIATGGLGGLPLAGLNSYVIESDAARQSGKSGLESELIGVINAGIDMWGVSNFLKFAKAGKGSAKALISNIQNKLWRQVGGKVYDITGTMLKQATVEGVEESLQEGVSLAVPAVISQEWPKKPDGSADWTAILSQIGEAGLGGGMAGGLMGGGLMMFQGTTAASNPTQHETDIFIEKVKSSQLNDIEKASILKQLGQPVTDNLENIRNKFDDAVSKIEKIRPEELEKIRIERGKRFGEFRDILEDVKNPRQRVALAKAALAGRLKMDIPALESYFTSDDIDFAYDTITRSTLLTESDLLKADEGLKKMLFDGTIPAPSELKPLVKCGLLTEQAATQLLNKGPLAQRAWREFLDISYAPWSTLTSFDVSASGRQGWKILFKDPKLWGRSLIRGYRMFASEDYYNFANLRRQTNPLYTQALRDGIDETGLGQFEKGEERFLSKTIAKIPGIKASGRAYTGMLNELRFGWYYQAIEAAGDGLTSSQRQDIATLANDLTGRGKLPKSIEKLQTLMPIFFAPRWVSSQIRSITDLVTLHGPARKMLAGTLASFFGFTLATLFLLDKHPDLDVEWNPLSSDFLKVKYGNTRIGIAGGYEQLFRVLWQLGAGKRKTVETERLQTVSRKDTIIRFLQSKLSPTAGLAVDIAKGETFRGKKITLGRMPENIYERTFPLFLQDVIDAMRYQGIGTAIATAPLGFHGITLQTYPVTPFQESIKYQNQLAKQYFNGAMWDEIGPAAQKVLTEHFPQIQFYKDKARLEREDMDFTAKLANESFNAGKNVFKKLPKAVKDELNNLSIPMPGLSRYIGNSWYLNDERYKTYQNHVQLILSGILNDLITDKDFMLLPMDIRRRMIQEIMDRTYAHVRLNLVTQANIKDVEQLK